MVWAGTSLVRLALAAQNMGMTWPIPTPTPPGGNPGAAVLVGALLWALVSVVVASESANRRMRRRAWGWMASFLAASLVTVYAFGGSCDYPAVGSTARPRSYRGRIAGGPYSAECVEGRSPKFAPGFLGCHH